LSPTRGPRATPEKKQAILANGARPTEIEGSPMAVFFISFMSHLDISSRRTVKF
jgi:hypothetical protein